jgi:hypothetical protein
MDRPSPWKKSNFFISPFSRERNVQPTIKVGMAIQVLVIYRLIPRKPGFLDYNIVFDPNPLVGFWMLLLALTTACNVKVFVSRHQSIDMHCIVLPVKLNGGLSIPVLINKQIFTKKIVGQKFTF